MKKKLSVKSIHVVDEEYKDFANNFKKLVEKNFSKIIKHNKPIGAQ